LRVHPGARRERIVGILGEALKVEVTRAPARGEATEAALALLASPLGVSRSAVRLVTGAHSRSKVVEIQGLTAELADLRLRALLDV
jgi:uncharacterized protein YggU (UPF0235/DUF167 family)